MTTASTSTEQRLRKVRKRLAQLLPEIRKRAEELAPHPGFLIEPVVETHTWVDPADGEAKYEKIYILVDGTEEEVRSFDSQVTDFFWDRFHLDDELWDYIRWSSETPRFMEMWRSIHKTTST